MVVWTSRGPYLIYFSHYFCIYFFSFNLPGTRDDHPQLGGDDGAGDGVLVTGEDGPGGRHLCVTIIIIIITFMLTREGRVNSYPVKDSILKKKK